MKTEIVGVDMAFDRPGRGGLNYHRCTYADSRLVFRGPTRVLDAPYVVAIGGTETFGSFVAHPFAAVLEQRTGLRIINLGVAGAGPEAFLNDPCILGIAAGARGAVLQMFEPHNLSNPLYRVHPRRNDRFLVATTEMRALYPEVDFMEYAFTRHLMQGLRAHGPKRFEKVRAILQASWVARMRDLLERLPRSRMLLWLSARPAASTEGAEVPVTPAMVQAVLPLADGQAEIYSGSTEGMVFGPTQRPAARSLPGPDAHERAAEALEAWVKSAWAGGSATPAGSR